MTGYGRGEARNGGVSIVVGLRSVNNRFRDVQLRTPREYLALESRLASRVKGAISRGRIDVFVHRTAAGAPSQVVVDAGLVEQLRVAIVPVAGGEPVPLGFLLEQPGVLRVEEAVVEADAEWPLLAEAVDAAVEGLRAMRRAEGQALHDDLSAHLQELSGLVAEVETVAEGVALRVRDRLLARLKALEVEHDPQRVAQEVALLADKADVQEELARLQSHVGQAEQALASPEREAVGRQLEFLVQEMNREVNTIGAKAVDHPVSQRVVAMKTVLERMREQAANVE